MKKRVREIVAIVLLALLGIGGICVMGWYMLAGHGWNVTASNIDDSIGQMDGYTVFLLEGTRQEPLLAKSEMESASADSAAKSEVSDNLSAEGQAAAEKVDLPRAEDSASELTDISLDEEEFSLETLSRNYQDKGAIVYRLDMNNKSLYKDSFIVAKNGRRVGVFALSNPARPAEARVDVKLLRHQKTDFIIAITEDESLKSTPINGIDIMICDERESEPVRGYYDGSTYYVDSPYLGQIEAIIVSPSGVISSKTIDSL